MATSPSNKPVKRGRLRLSWTVALLLIAAYASISGVYHWVRERPPTLEEAFPSGEMVVGVDASFPPFAVDTGQGLIGIDIEIARAIGAEIGIPVRFVTMGFDGLYDALIDKQVDIVISALLINPARTRDVRYTRPYFDNGLVLGVDDNTPPIRAMTDLPGYRLAFEYGSPAHSQINLWQRRLAAFEQQPYELPRYALDAVRFDVADTALVDVTSLRLYRAEHPDWPSNFYYVTHAFYAVALKQDNEAAYIWVDNTLGDLQNRGDIRAIIDRHFGDG